MRDFRKLLVWQKAKDLAVKIYKLSSTGTAFEKDFRFRDQIRSAAVSVASNIVEGDELSSNKQSIRHFYIAKGSTAELLTQLLIAHEIGYITDNEKAIYVDHCEHISKMLLKLIRARTDEGNRTPHTLHLTPYTANRTPYTLHRTPYTVHRKPHSSVLSKTKSFRKEVLKSPDLNLSSFITFL